VGLCVFLLVAAYVAYKRAPAAAKLPVDLLLGLLWSCLCSIARTLAFLGTLLGGLVGAALACSCCVRPVCAAGACSCCVRRVYAAVVRVHTRGYVQVCVVRQRQRQQCVRHRWLHLKHRAWV